jgi:hypothetical protein
MLLELAERISETEKLGSEFKRGKGKGHPITGHQGPRGGVEV